MSWVKNSILYTLYVCTATLVLLEIVGIFVFDNRYYWDLRYLTFSEKALVNRTATVNGTTEFWTFRPNSHIRFVATYVDFLGPIIEYDCVFTTNSAGFVDTGSDIEKVDFLVLGDSYTEGHGGCPWLTKNTVEADPVLSRLNILNGGLNSAGIRTFEKVLRLHEQEGSINNVVIIAISNDFKRDASQGFPVDDPCYTNLICNNHYLHFEKFNISKEQLLQKARQRRLDRNVPLTREVFRYSFVYRIWSKFRETVFLSGKEKRVSSNVIFAPYRENFDALKRILKKYPNTKIILVPQRDEVGLLGRENLDTKAVKRYFSENGIDFSTCHLGASDYMYIDGHPNAHGYKKLFNCLKQAVKL